jgi:hypothetical protein
VLLVALFIVLHIEIYPEVTGTVKDAGTGQGIESAIIAATYYKEMETIAGAVGQKMGVRYAVTDDNGAYRLTRYWSFSFFDFVDPEVKITALHPLYEKDDVFIRRESLPRYRDDRSVLWQVFIRKKWEFIKGAWFIDNKDKNEFGGVFDFFIRSLEEKYILEEQGNKEEVRRFDTIGIDYFKLGIKLKISKKAMARIFKKDEELFLKYKSNKEDFKYENKYFNNYKKKVMDTIGEL